MSRPPLPNDKWNNKRGRKARDWVGPTALTLPAIDFSHLRLDDGPGGKDDMRGRGILVVSDNSNRISAETLVQLVRQIEKIGGRVIMMREPNPKLTGRGFDFISYDEMVDVLPATTLEAPTPLPET